MQRERPCAQLHIRDVGSMAKTEEPEELDPDDVYVAELPLLLDPRWHDAVENGANTQATLWIRVSDHTLSWRIEPYAGHDDSMRLFACTFDKTPLDKRCLSVFVRILGIYYNGRWAPKLVGMARDLLGIAWDKTQARRAAAADAPTDSPSPAKEPSTQATTNTT